MSDDIERGGAPGALPEHTPTTDERLAQVLDELSAKTAEITALRSELTQRQVLDELKTTARNLRIPASVIDFDLQNYLPDFVLKDGRAVLRSNETMDAAAVLRQLQSQRQHWQPSSMGAGIDAGNTTGFGAVSNSQTWF